MSTTDFIFWSNCNPWLSAKAPRFSRTLLPVLLPFQFHLILHLKILCSFYWFHLPLWLPRIWLVWASSFTNFLYITLTQPNRFHNGSYNLLSKIFTNKTKLGCYSLVMTMQAVQTAAFYYVKPMKQFFCHWIFMSKMEVRDEVCVVQSSKLFYLNQHNLSKIPKLPLTDSEKQLA